MDAATAAAMSDPERNPAFRRRWHEQPDHHVPVQAPTPMPEVALEVTGRALLELWRQERRRHEGGRR
jgi:hypothetical protein